jgi:hypothetical protein
MKGELGDLPAQIIRARQSARLLKTIASAGKDKHRRGAQNACMIQPLVKTEVPL